MAGLCSEAGIRLDSQRGRSGVKRRNSGAADLGLFTPPTADIGRLPQDVRKVPRADIVNTRGQASD
jgi:hypothetical protein